MEPFAEIMKGSVSDLFRTSQFPLKLDLAGQCWRLLDARLVENLPTVGASDSGGALSPDIVLLCRHAAGSADFGAGGPIALGSGLSIGRMKGGDHRIIMRFPGPCHVIVDRAARAIAFDAPATVDDQTIKHHLADQVAPRVLASSGAFVLHGAAIALGDGCIVLMAPSGSGKSTLSAAFDLAGHDLMGDDAAVLRTDGNACFARAIYPSLRLLPDSLAALYPGRTDGVAMAAYSDKQRLDIAPRASLAAASDEAEPPERRVLGAFLLDRAARHESVSFTPLDVPRACMHLVENSFLLDPADPAVNHANLTQAAALAERMPFARLSYPDDLTRLPEVVAAIVKHVTGSSITPAAG